MTRTINTPNGLITCTIAGGFLTLAGPAGAHRVMVDERTNVEAHVAGFVEANGGEAPVITYGKIGPKVVTNPITEDDRGAYCVEEADIESAQPVYVDGKLVGELVRLYSQARGTGCDEPTVLGGYVFMETDAAYYNVTEDARVVYAGNARQVLADIKAAIAAVAAW